MRKDEIQDVKDPGCARDIAAMLGVLVGVGTAIGLLYYGVIAWS